MSHDVRQKKYGDELRDDCSQPSLGIAIAVPVKPRTHDSMIMSPNAAYCTKYSLTHRDDA